MNKLKKLKTQIEDSIYYKISRAIMYVVVIMLLIVIVVQNLSKNNLSIGGFRVFVIVSESMKGEYDIGDIIISKSVDVEDINIGDNVTYKGEVNEFKGIIVTHKVVEKKQKGNDYYFVTRGIANQIEDPEIRYDQIYGKVVYKTVFLSFIAKLMNNQLTYYVLFTLIALIISIEIVSSMFEKEDVKEEDERR